MYMRVVSMIGCIFFIIDLRLKYLENIDAIWAFEVKYGAKWND